MMDTIRLTIEGTPVAQKRHRSRMAGNKIWQYDPSASAKTAARIQVIKQLPEGMQLQLPCFAKGVPLVLILQDYLAIPKSWSKKKKELALQGKIYPTVRPDWDNLGKAPSDYLNGIVYHDDCQIIKATVEKFYSDNPRTEIIVHRVGV